MKNVSLPLAFSRRNWTIRCLISQRMCCLGSRMKQSANNNALIC
jgi:hypothetical protein